LVCAFDPREYVFYFTIIEPSSYLFGIDVDAQKLKSFLQYPTQSGTGVGDYIMAMTYSSMNRTLLVDIADRNGLTPRGIFAVDPVLGTNRSIISGSQLNVSWAQSSSYDADSNQWFMADTQAQLVYQVIDLNAGKVTTTAQLPNSTCIYAVTWVNAAVTTQTHHKTLKQTPTTTSF